MDDIGLRAEADLIRFAALAHIPLQLAEEYELWELAAAAGLHLTETMDDRDTRRIDAEKRADYEANKAKRDEIMARQAERRRERKRKR